MRHCKKGKIRTPPHQDGREGREAETDEYPKVLRPRLRLSEVRSGPVESSHATREFAVPGKERFRVGGVRIVAVHHAVPRQIGLLPVRKQGIATTRRELPECPTVGLQDTAGSNPLLP